MDHIGIDVHKRESQICIETGEGEVIEKRIRTERERFIAMFGGRPRAKILIEAMTESEWVARSFEATRPEGGRLSAERRRRSSERREPGR